MSEGDFETEGKHTALKYQMSSFLIKIFRSKTIQIKSNKKITVDFHTS